MKYNEEAFHTSAQFYSSVDEMENDNSDKELQTKLLPILLKRFSKELKDNPEQNKGIIKTRFIAHFWQDADEGYDFIRKLVESNKFDSFGRDYCFYLGDVENMCDERHSAYFEIIWDYRTYFESLSMSQIHVETESTTPSKNAHVQALVDFKQLPLKYQLEVLESFSIKVRYLKKNFLHEEAVKVCLKEGHQFSNWEERTCVNVESADDWLLIQAIPDLAQKYHTWVRTCSRCGYTESVNQEPQELIDEGNRKEKKKQAKIKRLEKQLKKLKEED